MKKISHCFCLLFAGLILFFATTPLQAQPLDITVTPSVLVFGSIVVDNTSVAQTVTITNTSIFTDTVTSDITGDSAAMFAVAPGATNGCAVPTDTLGPSEACTLAVTFTPSALGAQSASLEILATGSVTGTVEVDLSGTGVLPDIAVTPATLAFGPIFFDNTSVAQTVTITNTSIFTDTVTSDITGDSAAMFAVAPGATNGCAVPTDTLGPSEACTLAVTFTPSALGAQSASLEILATGSVTGTVQVALSGTGVYEATPSALEGTYGTEIQYGGAPSGFGDKKGKIYINGVKQKVDSWANTSITMIFTKFKDMAVDTPYDVSIQWKPKGSKTTNIIDLPGAFTLRKPLLPPTNTYSGAAGSEFTIPLTDAQWLGTKKGKVFIGGEKCKVKAWTMNPTTGASSVTFVISKKLGASTYLLEVENKIGRALSAGFTVTAPAP